MAKPVAWKSNKGRVRFQPVRSDGFVFCTVTFPVRDGWYPASSTAAENHPYLTGFLHALLEGYLADRDLRKKQKKRSETFRRVDDK